MRLVSVLVGLIRWLWTWGLGKIARHRPVVLALLSSGASAAVGIYFQHPQETVFGYVSVVLVFLIVLSGIVPSRYAAAELLTFMLPAMYKVLELSGDDRITVHHLKSTWWRQTYEQLTEYHPDPKRPTRGRVFPLSHGIVAQCFHNGQPVFWSMPEGKTFEDAMTDRWTFTEEQRKKLRQDRRSFMAYPLGQEGPYARAVLYMDSADSKRFSAETFEGYKRHIEEYFLPQLKEALRSFGA